MKRVRTFIIYAMLCILTTTVLFEVVESQGISGQICASPTFFIRPDNCVFVAGPNHYKCPSIGTFPHAHFQTNNEPIDNTSSSGFIFQGSWNYGNVETIEICLAHSGAFTFNKYKINCLIDGTDVTVDDQFGNVDGCTGCLPGFPFGETQVRAILTLEPENLVSIDLYINGTLIILDNNQKFILDTAENIFSIDTEILRKVAIWNFTVPNPEDVESIKNREPTDVVCKLGRILEVSVFWAVGFLVLLGIVIIVVIGVVVIVLVYFCTMVFRRTGGKRQMRPPTGDQKRLLDQMEMSDI